MKRKLTRTLLAGVIALSFFTGCGSTAQTTSTQAPSESSTPAASESTSPETTTPDTPELTEVTAYGVIDPQVSAQQIIADKKGFFEEEGIKVTNKLIQSGGDMSPLISGNTAEVSFETTYTDIALAANGVKVVMLAPMADIGGTQSVVARKGLEITSAKDLEGKKLGIPAGAGVLVAIRKMCEELSVDIDKITFVTLNPADQIAALERGDIDLMACWEPWVGNAIEAGGTLLFSGLKSYLPENNGQDVQWLNFHTTFQVTEKFLKENPKTVEAMLRALSKATEFINNNREEAAEIIAVEINLDKAQVVDIMSKNTYSMEFNQAFVDGTNIMATFMKEMDNIKEVPDFDGFADSTPLKNAVPALVTAE